jgi:hypothetical protein
MLRCTSSFSSLALLAALGGSARAQSSGDISAYNALVLTPPGALAPVLHMPGPSARRTAFDIRYGYFPKYDDQPMHHVAAGVALPVGGSTVDFTAGTTFCDKCGSRILAGVDLLSPLSTSALRIALQPAVGFGYVSGDGKTTALSAALSLPLWYPIDSSDGFTFSPFLSPGLGFGHLSALGSSESGMRPLLGGGLALGSRSGLMLHVAFQKVFITGGETLLGMGISIAAGRR